MRAWARTCVALLAIVLTFGCTKTVDPDPTNTRNVGPEPAQANNTEGLTGATAITLAAPNPISPIAPVLEASNSVRAGHGANVVSGMSVAMGTGGVDAEPASALNETWSRGKAIIESLARVRGTLHASSRSVGAGAVVSSLDTTPALDPPSTLSFTVVYPSSSGSDVTLLLGQRTIAPGRYRNVTVGAGAALTLSTGTYYLTSLNMIALSTVKLDQTNGPVIIYVSDLLTFAGTFTALNSAPPDLLVAYLGTLPVVLASRFDGAIVAPFTSLTLGPVLGIHTGFFAAKDVKLGPLAQVQYRAPFSIITVVGPDGPTCRKLISGTVPPAQVESTVARYCKTCPNSDDRDNDGVPNCLDGCPYDSTKTQRGVCGCGTPETDSDGDGVPDCIDQCPQDPNNTSRGQCGCAGQPNLPPAGTPCNDPACPQSGSTCDGAGVCGNRSICTPNPGCKLVTWHGTSYWLCIGMPGGTNADGGTIDAGASPPPQTWPNAQLACGNKGLTLLRIDSLTENQEIARFLSSPIWLGANDLSSAGVWRWAAPGTNSGDQFWQGTATGSPVAGRFSSWGQGAPGAQQCAAMTPSSGQWSDVACNQALGYACVYRVPIVRADGGGVLTPTGMPEQPPQDNTPCIPEQDSGLPDSIEALQQQLAMAEAGDFQGAAANPPPDGSTCQEKLGANAIGTKRDSGAGCSFDNPFPKFECFEQSNCAPLGSDLECRQIKDDLSCFPPDAGPPPLGTTCRGHGRCVRLQCPSNDSPCGELKVCNPNTDFDAGLDPGSALDAAPFQPASLFNGLVPDAAPSSAYSDPPTGVGTSHKWCSMASQDPDAIKNAQTAVDTASGSSGRGSKIKFDFDPDLIFDAQANPLALGETALHLHAQAKLGAAVTLNDFLGQSFRSTIVEAGIGVTVDRCSISDVHDTFFNVFGVDAIPLSALGIPQIDSNDPGSSFYTFSKDCNAAVGAYQLAADQAKKAFRDAQQLLAQYYAAKALKGSLTGDLCSKIGVIAANVPFFPGGNSCPTDEPVELTINRFVDFYQKPGIGKIALLQKADADLGAKTAQYAKKLGEELAQSGLSKDFTLTFANLDNEESQTIVNVPFAIGPVPMVLQVDVFARYGIAGNFDLNLDFPLNLFTPANGEPSTIAHAGARVVPYAGAGLAAFVGVGFDLGVIAATIGIEGAVSLASIKAPVFAGAGLQETVTSDVRAVPNDIQPPVSIAADAFQFAVPKSFKFSVMYDYGAAVDLQDVLAGSINGRLRIKFVFFSRTWRKQIVKFNGWSEHFNLLSGGSEQVISDDPTLAKDDTKGVSANITSGAATMGRSEAQVPLMVLGRLTVPPAGVTALAPADAGPVVDFDAAALQGFFYDDMCCSKTTCSLSPLGRPKCCPGFDCVLTSGDAAIAVTSCVPVCKKEDESCSTSADCCPGTPTTRALVCGTLNTCVQCAGQGEFCDTTADCCAGFGCSGNQCQAIIK